MPATRRPGHLKLAIGALAVAAPEASASGSSLVPDGVPVDGDEPSGRFVLLKNADGGPSVLLNASDGPRLIINHLPKCGGTFIKKVVAKATSQTWVKMEAEGDRLDSVDFAHNFVVGLIRNPFNWYASLWAFTSEPKSCCQSQWVMTQEERQRMLSQDKPHGRSWQDRLRFDAWTSWLNDELLGTMSMRFFGHYLNAADGDSGAIRAVQKARFDRLRRGHSDVAYQRITSRQLANQSREESEGIASILRNYSRSASYRAGIDCWVHTESLRGDLVACLHQYEAVARERNPGGEQVVDWAALNAAMNSVPHNAADYVSCTELYSSNSSLVPYVADADLPIFEKFGYDVRGCS